MRKEQVFVAKGNAPWFSNNWLDINKVISMNKLDLGTTVACDGNVTDMAYMFYECHSLTSLDLSNFNTSNVKDMGYMFESCFDLIKLDLSNFDTSNVDNMKYMFFCCSLTSLDLSNFDTSKVTNMNEMFEGCNKLATLDISNFDTSKVKDMQDMFGNCSSLTTIKGIIDMRSCKYYGNMFDRCPRLTGVKIKNPPVDFERKSRLSKSQYTIVS